MHAYDLDDVSSTGECRKDQTIVEAMPCEKERIIVEAVLLSDKCLSFSRNGRRAQGRSSDLRR